MSLIWLFAALRELTLAFHPLKTTLLSQSDSRAAALTFVFKFQERVTAPLMCYQFKSKVILLTCLCSVDTSALRLHCKAIEGSYSRDRVSQFDNRAECRLWHKPGCSGCLWHSSGCGLEKAANCPSFNTDLPFRELGASAFSAFLFLPRFPFPHSFSLLLSECNPWQWKVTSFLQHPPPPPPFAASKPKFNCLWHHVWLLWATRQPGRDCEVQWASTNSLFLFPCLIWFFLPL